GSSSTSQASSSLKTTTEKSALVTSVILTPTARHPGGNGVRFRPAALHDRRPRCLAVTLRCGGPGPPPRASRAPDGRGRGSWRDIGAGRPRVSADQLGYRWVAGRWG